MNLGVAFQLVDDALDYAADQRHLGKTVGDDFREGKITLPVLLAYQAADAEECAFWQRTVGALEQEPADLDRALTFMGLHDAFRATLARAAEFAAAAGEALRNAFPPSPFRHALIEICDYTVRRGR